MSEPKAPIVLTQGLNAVVISLEWSQFLFTAFIIFIGIFSFPSA